MDTCWQLGGRPRRANFDLAPPLHGARSILDLDLLLDLRLLLVVVFHRLYSAPTAEVVLPEVFKIHGTHFRRWGGGQLKFQTSPDFIVTPLLMPNTFQT